MVDELHFNNVFLKKELASLLKKKGSAFKNKSQKSKGNDQ